MNVYSNRSMNGHDAISMAASAMIAAHMAQRAPSSAAATARAAASRSSLAVAALDARADQLARFIVADFIGDSARWTSRFVLRCKDRLISNGSPRISEFRTTPWALSRHSAALILKCRTAAAAHSAISPSTAGATQSGISCSPLFLWSPKV